MWLSLSEQGVERDKWLLRHALRWTVWGRILLACCVILSGYILYGWGEGFPPRAWGQYLLFLVGNGGSVMSPFALVTTEALVFLLAYILLLLISLHLVRPMLHYRWRQSAVRVQNATAITPSAHSPTLKAGGSLHRQAISASRRTTQQSTARLGRRPSPASLSHYQADTHPVEQLILQPDLEEEASALLASDLARPRGEVVAPGLLTLLTASSRDDSPPTPFTVGGTPLALMEGQVESPSCTVAGTLLCDPGPRSDLERCEDALLIASGFCSTRTNASPARSTSFSLFIVADTTTAKATQPLASHLCTYASRFILSALSGQAPLETTAVHSLLKNSIQQANTLLCQRNQASTAACTATMTVLLVLGETGYIAYVGDNRVYVYRPRKGLAHITRKRPPATREPESLPSGTREQLSQEPGAADMLGREATVHIDTRLIDLQAQDLVIVCSDGLWQPLRSSAIERLVIQSFSRSHATPAQLGPTLLRAAQEAGGTDHKSLIIGSVGRAGETRAR